MLRQARAVVLSKKPIFFLSLEETDMVFLFLLVATFFLAYVNGANDNFKGVATLFGSQTTSYRGAIVWATCTTMAGSLGSVMFTATLVKRFSGKGLVPDVIANSVTFHIAIALAAGFTVILATVTSFPISTTHALTGALTGAGVVAGWWEGQALVNWGALQNTFVLPLLFSPLCAIGLGMLAYGILRDGVRRLGLHKETCICLGKTSSNIAAVPVSLFTGTVNLPVTVSSAPELIVDDTRACQERYVGRIFGVQVQGVLDVIHFGSAGLVSCARGLNDTPKLVSLILIEQTLSLQVAAGVMALSMALGGWLNARRVAETMSHKITSLSPGQGLAANSITAFLVILASIIGLPVSTTHVSVGSIFGAGTISRTADANIFGQILLSWGLTLPIAALLSGGVYAIARLLLG
jgi:PiT family inorganic phosphate transporter